MNLCFIHGINYDSKCPVCTKEKEFSTERKVTQFRRGWQRASYTGNTYSERNAYDAGLDMWRQYEKDSSHDHYFSK